MGNSTKRQSSVYGNVLYIIDCLGDDASRTAEQLFQDLKLVTIKLPEFSVEHIVARSIKDLVAAFDLIRLNATNHEKFPIIHLDAHGDEDGFVIGTEDQELPWRELNTLLAPINVACRNNLILSLGICYGHWSTIDLVRIINDNGRSPFMLTVSPMAEVSPNDVLLGFCSFYSTLFQRRSIDQAIAAMNSETVLNIMRTSDSVAEETVAEIKRMVISPGYSDQTARQLVDLLNKGKFPTKHRTFNRQLKEFKQWKLQEFKSELERRWSHFLMLDLFSENAARFASFDDILEKHF